MADDFVEDARYAKLPHDEWYNGWTWAELLTGQELHYSGENAEVAEGFDPTQIAEIALWHVEEGTYGPEHNAAGMFRMEDGRYVVYTGWCDTSGWGCQGGARFTMHDDREDAVRNGMGDEERGWFKIENPT